MNSRDFEEVESRSDVNLAEYIKRGKNHYLNKDMSFLTINPFNKYLLSVDSLFSWNLYSNGRKKTSHNRQADKQEEVSR